MLVAAMTVACLGIAQAQATTLTFNDITTNPNGTVPNGYGGLDWNNAGLQSLGGGEYVAYNPSGGDPMVVVSAIQDFVFYGADFWSAFLNGLRVTAIGLQDGAPIFNESFLAETGIGNQLAFSPSVTAPIDTLMLMTSYNGNPGWFPLTFAMDNFNFTWSGQNSPNAPVPEPTTMVLFASGLMLLSANRIRRQKA